MLQADLLSGAHSPTASDMSEKVILGGQRWEVVWMHLVQEETALAASVMGLACWYVMSSEQEEIVILERLHELCVRTQLSFSHGSDLLWRLSKLPCFPPATLHSLQQALEVSADLAMSKVFPGRRAGRRARKVLSDSAAVEHAVAHCLQLMNMPSALRCCREP